MTQRRTTGISRKIQTFTKIFMLVLSIMGLVTFSLFIFEESLQTVMFGTWPAKNVKRYDIVLEGIDLNRKINRTMKIVNYCFGWIQPLAFMSYHAYAKATDYYTDSLEAEILANRPALLVGRTLSVRFTATSENSNFSCMGNVCINKKIPLGQSIDIQGELSKIDDRYFMIGASGLSDQKVTGFQFLEERVLP